jgi:hypothetical protein
MNHLLVHCHLTKKIWAITRQLCKSQEQWIGDNMKEILNEWITIAAEEDKFWLWRLYDSFG